MSFGPKPLSRIPTVALAPALAVLGLLLAPQADAATLDITFGLDAGSPVFFSNSSSAGAGTLAGGELDVSFQGNIVGGGTGPRYFFGTMLQINRFAAQVTGVSAPFDIVPTSGGGNFSVSLGGPGMGYAIALTNPIVFYAAGIGSGLTGAAKFGMGQFVNQSGTAPATGSLYFFGQDLRGYGYGSGYGASIFASISAFPSAFLPVGVNGIQEPINITLQAFASEIDARFDEVIPEPSSIALFGLGALLVGGHIGRRARRR